ncbi:single-stranded DNA-binding protein [Arthrobacter sp. NPDC056727]|uniref:single-stranded DNA-binding protein n=1 Tax=Arthrobacter sp. NPDC056727 TaxID=3345927 RepID=UPI00366B65FF
MNGETSTTIIGNLTADPQLRTVSGAAVANFTIASTPRIFDAQAGEWKDGETLFLRASVWRGTAENAAASLAKGSRVVVTGRLKPRTYETKAGEKRSVIELEVDEIGLSLRHTASPREPAPNEDKPAAPSQENTAPEGEDRRTRQFTISPRLYANDDVWFGKQANPSGRVDLPAAPEEPAY